MSVSIDGLVRASGLSPMFARNAIQRAVDRCGVRLEDLTPADAERLLEDLQRVVGIFDPDHVDDAAKRLRALLLPGGARV